MDALRDAVESGDHGSVLELVHWVDYYMLLDVLFIYGGNIRLDVFSSIVSALDPGDLETMLADAVHFERYEQALILLKRGTWSNRIFSYSKSFLMDNFLCKLGHDRERFYCLQMAFRRNEVDQVRRLLAKGWSVRQRVNSQGHLSQFLYSGGSHEGLCLMLRVGVPLVKACITDKVEKALQSVRRVSLASLCARVIRVEGVGTDALPSVLAWDVRVFNI